MKAKSLLFFPVFLLLSAFAVAQSTPYSAPNFSTIFNSPVTTTSRRNNAGTSTDYFYNAKNNKDIEQVVTVRTVDHDIDLDKSSTDFYAGQASKNMALDDRKDGIYQGHMYVSVQVHNATRERKVRVILVNSRTVLILFQQAPVGTDDSADWNTLVNSLVVK
jgi:hypothetical protein